MVLAFSLAALKVSAPLLTLFPMNLPMFDRFLALKRSEKLEVLEMTGAKFFLAADIAMFSSYVVSLASHLTVYSGKALYLHSSVRYLHEVSISPVSLRKPETQMKTWREAATSGM